MNASIFKFINHHFAKPFLDPIMLAITFMGEGIIASGISLFMIVYGIVKKQAYIHSAGCAGLLSYVLSGAISQVLKKQFLYPRPLLELYEVRVVGESLYTQSFPSGHTTTAFALAIALGSFFPKLRIYFLVCALLVGFSRIYVGAHYPFDVLGGAVLGCSIGLFSAYIIKRRNISKEKIPCENEKCLTE